jgi:predicted ATPase
LVILEDLHSVDPETQVLIDGVIDSLPAARVVLLVLAGQSIAMAGAARVTTRRFESTLYHRALPETCWTRWLALTAAWSRVKKLLIEKTGGTPFFLEERCALVETGR